MNTVSGLDVQQRPRPPRIFASFLLLTGIVLTAGGVRLVSLGGSLYYVVAGIVLVACAVLLWRGQRCGDYLYALLTIGTILWALVESEFDGWALAPRVLPFLVLGLWLLRPKARRGLGLPAKRPLLASPLSWIAIAALCIGIAMRKPSESLPFAAGTSTAESGARDWQHWGGTAAGTRYASLRSNQHVERCETAGRMDISHRGWRSIQGDTAADRRHALRLLGQQHHRGTRR